MPMAVVARLVRVRVRVRWRWLRAAALLGGRVGGLGGTDALELRRCRGDVREIQRRFRGDIGEV